jgi:hypothetical protein
LNVTFNAMPFAESMHVPRADVEAERGEMRAHPA